MRAEYLAVAAFVCGAAFIFYSLAGYPLLIRWLASRSARLPRREFRPEPVTVLLPVHNGGQWLRQKLDSILALDYPRELVRVVVISDGSTDDTEAIAESYAASGVTLLRMAKGGKARALNRGLEAVSGGLVFFTDVRQRLDRGCLRFMVERFSDPEVGAVCGELVILDGTSQAEVSIGLYWKLEKWIRRQLSAMGTLFVVTGCLYAVRRELADPLPADILGDDIFMPQTILRKRRRVVFEDRARAYDYPTGRDVEFSRKVRTLAGLYQYVAKQGLGPHPFHFFSYKVSRLLLPWALFAVAVSSVFLPAELRVPALGAQAAFYGLALLDPVVGERSPLKKLSSPARTFCMLMAASAAAVSVFFVPAGRLWTPSRVGQRRA